MHRKTILAFAIASLIAGSALAAVSADEAKQLGTTLTPVAPRRRATRTARFPNTRAASRLRPVSRRVPP
jgi:hypothetical protein